MECPHRYPDCSIVICSKMQLSIVLLVLLLFLIVPIFWRLAAAAALCFTLSGAAARPLGRAEVGDIYVLPFYDAVTNVFFYI